MSQAHDAVLSSLTDSVQQVVEQVAALAETLDRDGAAGPSAVLYEAERSLRVAVRSLDRARQLLPS